MIAFASSGSIEAEVALDHRRGALDACQRLDLRPLEATARDREVLDGALGLRPPPGVRRHPNLAHRVALDPILAHRLKSGVSVSVNRMTGGMR